MAKLAIMNALTEYEKTGDHNHGQGAISPGGPCGQGDDCIVSRTREALRKFGNIF